MYLSTYDEKVLLVGQKEVGIHKHWYHWWLCALLRTLLSYVWFL